MNKTSSRFMQIPYYYSTRYRIKEEERFNALPLLFFVLLHIPLAFALTISPTIPTLHALITLAIGSLFALSSRSAERVIFVGAYIVGAEVLWRMTDASVFWEFGKYAFSIIFIIYIIRSKKLSPSPFIVIFFILLLPSVVLTFFGGLNTVEIRDQLSFNMSGPFAMMTSVWLLSQVRFTFKQIYRIAFIIIAPIVAIATVSVFNLSQAPVAEFTLQSNSLLSNITSANQISSILGLGALFVFIYLLLSRTRRMEGHKLILAVLFMAFLLVSIIPFSRNGLYLALSSAAVLSFSLISDNRSRKRIIVLAILFLLAGYYLIPILQDFTDGLFLVRFQDLDPTKRIDIASLDYKIWLNNPLFGVGPGMARYERSLVFGYRISAHTEFTRLLAEHGIFGLTALISLFAFSIQSFFRSKERRQRGFQRAMITWAILYMAVNAMRLVAPAFLFGLAAIPLISDKLESE